MYPKKELVVKKDAVQVLKEGDNFFTQPLRWSSRLLYRRFYVIAYKEGYFSLGDFLKLFFLPISSPTKKEILSRKGELQLFGKPFYGIISDAMSFIEQVIILDQYHAKQYIKKDSIVIDAGANIGSFSVFAADLATEGSVYAFEPATGTFRILQKNIADNPRITGIPAGLGDSIRNEKLLVKGDGDGGSVFEGTTFFSNLTDATGEIESARVTTLDAFVAEHAIPRVDFIKIDTEGYEAKILQGAKETIKKWKPVIAMSAYHNPNDKRDLPELLKSICPDYICELHRESEEDLICHI